MNTELAARSEGRCELCGAAAPLTEQAVSPKKGQSAEECVAVCATCDAATAEPTAHADHWRCLNDSMWSPVPAVQVRVYRLLGALSTDWASDLKDRMYLDEATLEWADDAPTSVVHKDAYGVLLQHGDTVVLTEHLDVKGTNFTAKKGTVVRNIRLDRSNADYIEGRVEGQEIVILTKFVKRQARD
jgi:protein PhnA